MIPYRVLHGPDGWRALIAGPDGEEICREDGSVFETLEELAEAVKVVELVMREKREALEVK